MDHFAPRRPDAPDETRRDRPRSSCAAQAAASVAAGWTTLGVLWFWLIKTDLLLVIVDPLSSASLLGIDDLGELSLLAVLPLTMAGGWACELAASWFPTKSKARIALHVVCWIGVLHFPFVWWWPGDL